MYKRARVLKLVSEGYSQSKASVLADVSESTSKRICLRYREKGLEAVYDSPRCGSPKKIHFKAEAKSCGDGLFFPAERVKSLDDPCYCGRAKKGEGLWIGR